MPLLLGFGGVTLLLALVSPARLADAMASFDARLVPLLLALATADYAVRFWRWRLLVKLAAGKSLPLGADIACFLAANTLILTPARAGDLSRAAYAQALARLPASQTATVPVLERVVDVVLMSSLAAMGTLAFGATPLFAAGGCLLVLAVVVLLRSAGAQALLAGAAGRLAGSGAAAQARSFFAHLDSLWRPRPLTIGFGLGALAWSLECVAFFVVLWGLGLQPTPELAGQAGFIYPVANLAGSLSLLPGGLGVAEGSIAGLTRSLAGADPATALAAGLLIRAAIVGFGVVTGLPGLLYVSSRMTRGDAAGRPVEAPATASAI